MGFVPEEPGPADVIAEQRELLSRLRAVVEAKDTEITVLLAELSAERELRRRQELRIAEFADTAVDVFTRTGNPDAIAAALRAAELIQPSPEG